jgi:hypothetical protein
MTPQDAMAAGRGSEIRDGIEAIKPSTTPDGFSSDGVKIQRDCGVCDVSRRNRLDSLGANAPSWMVEFAAPGRVLRESGVEGTAS